MKNEQQWFEHGIYRNYWRTYGQAMDWCNRHRTAYWRATARANHFENTALRQATAVGRDTTGRRSIVIPSTSSRQRALHRSPGQASTSDFETSFGGINAYANRKAGRMTRTQVLERTRSADAGDLFEMEITDDMIEFLEKSEQHREERQAKRDAEVQANAQDIHESGAPKEQPGVRRTAEMKSFYGSRAPIIHGMETAVQLTFHRNCDHNRPRLWPNIALNLQF